MRSSFGCSRWSSMIWVQVVSRIIVSSSSIGPDWPGFSRMRWMNVRNRSPSLCGTPSMWAMTRTGMCCAYSSAASTSVRPDATMSSISSRQKARVGSSSGLIAFGENAGSRMRRACSWKGGSEVMGGAKPTGAGMPGRKSRDHDPVGAEVLGVVGDHRHVVVTGRQPRTAEPVGVRDRAAFPQVVPDRDGSAA